MGDETRRTELSRRLVHGLNLARADDGPCETTTVAGVQEFISRLREQWPSPEEGGVYDPVEKVRQVWAAMLKVPGVTLPSCPTLPDCGFVTRLRGNRADDGNLWQEFHNALTTAQGSLDAVTQGREGEPAKPTGNERYAATAESKTAEENVGGENTNEEMPTLSKRQYLILEAMKLLNAVSADSRCATDEIAIKAEGSAASVVQFKEPIAMLKSLGFLKTKEGRGGGCWLTEDGLRWAEKL